MIVPMKKVSLLVMDKNKEDALDKIREIGVVHLEEKAVSSPALDKLAKQQSQIEAAMGILYGYASKKKAPAEPPEIEGDLTERVIYLSERRKRLQDYMFNHQREIGRFDRWGEFDPDDFEYLENNGVTAHLYEISLESYKSNVGDVPVIVLAMNEKQNYVRLLAFGEIQNEQYWPMPERPLSVVNERHEIRKAEMEKIERELKALSPLREKLEEDKQDLQAEIEYEAALAGMNLTIERASSGSTDLSISWISGYAPASDLDALKKAASENNWALHADDPGDADMNVPTKMKNNRFISLTEPVMGFLDLYPGYREVDVSGWFLPFLALFFGMIFGDGAYGAVLLLISLVLMLKSMKKGVPVLLKFVLLMSVSSLVWGVLTGVWFGLDIASVPQFLQNISLPQITGGSDEPGWLAAYNASNLWIRSGLATAYATPATRSFAIEENLKLFCFTVALVHLGIAHLKRFFINIRSLKALAEIGHLGMLVAMYYVVLSMIVYNTGFGGVSSWQLYLLGGGFVLVLVFSNYAGSIPSSLAGGCKDIIGIFLSVTGAFSDITSYIRLWAVGLAGGAIASTVNGFSRGMFGKLSVLVFGILLFAFGHCFNMVLNAMSFLVHGVRLNTLEFSSHMGIEWTGLLYKPFANKH